MTTQHQYIVLLLSHKYKEIPFEIWIKIMSEAKIEIITMTFSSNLNTKLDIEKLGSVFKIDNLFKNISYDCKRKTKRGKNPINYLRAYLAEDKIGGTIQICSNGGILMKGFKTDKNIKYIFNHLVTKIKNIEKNELKSILTNVEFKPKEYKCKLVNTKFNCNSEIEMKEIEEIQKLVTDEGYESKYISPNNMFIVRYFDKENQKTDINLNSFPLKKTSIFIVENSNKIIITGPNINETNKTYTFINKILNKVQKNKLINSKKKKCNFIKKLCEIR